MKPSTKLTNQLASYLNLRFGISGEVQLKEIKKELQRRIEEVYPPEAKPVVVPMAGRDRKTEALAQRGRKTAPAKKTKVEAKKAKPLQKQAAKPAIAEKRRGRPAKAAK